MKDEVDEGEEGSPLAPVPDPWPLVPGPYSSPAAAGR